MKGISFSPEMCAAIRLGRKTQTRRIANGDTPPFKAGDTVYVREYTRIEWFDDHYAQVRYADGYVQKVVLTEESWKKILKRKKPHRLMPPRYMLADFARLVIRVESVQREKLQDITERDAIAEGVDSVGKMFYNYRSGGYSLYSPVSSFVTLWRKIHPNHEGWDTEVWKIIFSL